MPYLLYAVLLVGSAFVIAFTALLAFGLLDRRHTSRLRQFSATEQDAVVFLFEDETLLDATPAARQLLESANPVGTAWAHLAGILAPRFPDLGEQIRDLAELGELRLTSVDGTSDFRAEWHDGVVRITLDAATPDDPAEPIDGHSLLAMTQELDALRANASHTPYPLWRENADGMITWCNTAYLDLAEALRGSDDLPSWPPDAIFDIQTDDSHAEPAEKRIAIALPGQDTRHWFEVTASDMSNGDRFLSAIPADRLVRAETSLEEFVTTLTKTFASLPIGLAIFDRSRELALFNPALMDLTVLPADFLVSKPSLSAFLDRLRTARMIPEPKDYRTWRQQMSDLEAAAQNGTYEENWALPTGQTYRVTGRPHPDGAVALLFEDISSEITATRRFRAEVETSQAALDALPQAVAVFTPGGVLSISNTAYTELWGTDPGTSFADVTVHEALDRWQARSAPTTAWEQLRAFISQSGPREGWAAQVPLRNGQVLTLDVTPLAHGSTMISFVHSRPQIALPAADAVGEDSPPEVAAAEA